MITKAVIAAAGRGTRFLPVVKAYPKELVPILSKPNIQYLIEEAIGAGITDIAIVIRSGETKIQDYFSPDENLEKYLLENNKIEYLDSLKSIWAKAKLTFITQPANLPYGTGSPLLAAKEFIASDPFVYMYGDDLTVEAVPGQFLSKMIATFEKYQASEVIAVKDVGKEEISRYGAAQYVDDPKYPHRLSAMLEKLPADQAPSTFAQGGRFVATSKLFAILEQQGLSRDGELWFSDASNTLAKTDIVLTESFEGDEDWLTTGDPLRWLKANITLALQDPKLKDDLLRFLRK
ncbi:MAG: sugar phosphate nucleotidyltransferase [Candidatus Shapirobacteria bacterium]|nr:sugar phosphate nucleotidyltransferase [Candidatus Shapirobacteria bacterium]MDD4410292.1 sugar phosphate nucleotidyltransferase [Candidatus Shapirobacteria bacterium]